MYHYTSTMAKRKPITAGNEEVGDNRDFFFLPLFWGVGQLCLISEE